MGGPGSGRERAGKRKAVQKKAFIPEGAEGKKRTPFKSPLHEFDKAAGKETYELEMVIASMIRKKPDGRAATYYEVKWAGYEHSVNTGSLSRPGPAPTSDFFKSF